MINYISLLLTFSSILEIAQNPIYECTAPPNNQYLVLIKTATEASQNLVKNSLSSTPINNIICNYQGELVTRIGEFNSLQEAQKWADYFINTVKLTAVVATSPHVKTGNEQPFQPQSLDTGYAILIDYFNRPEIASGVSNFLKKDIGLAVYLSRPYLIAIQTKNEREAQFMLQQLTEKGFWAISVDSRFVTLLTPKVTINK